MLRRLAGIVWLCTLSLAMSAQSRSAVGRLQVTAIIVSSSQVIELPDGSFRLVVANSPSNADTLSMQLAVNQPEPDSNVTYSQNTITVSLVPRDQLPKPAKPRQRR